jgi:hypothetical protein
VTGFQADPDSLREAGKDLFECAQTLNTRWQAFDAQAKGRGDIFGDDMVGGLIGASYQVAHQIAGEAYLSVVKAFAEFGQGLAAMADSYQVTDESSSATFEQFGKI